MPTYAHCTWFNAEGSQDFGLGGLNHKSHAMDVLRNFRKEIPVIFYGQIMKDQMLGAWLGLAYNEDFAEGED